MGEPARCGWAQASAEYAAYHDDEWGRPLRGVGAMFERLSLEAFQSGLSWLVILRRRPAFRAAFAGFDPAAVARELKRRGLRFVGPTTCYALMQAAGLVDDHVQGCWPSAT